MTTSLPVVTDSSAVLPPLYARWADEILGGPIPQEREATCESCAMCADESTPEGSGGYFFNPRTKCCTYQPELSNFLVGRVLEDESPAMARGRASVLARIHAGIGTSPLGLMQTAKFKLLFQNTVSGFGRSESLLCPHFLAEEGGRCGVWAHRESMCATWFCKHNRGPTGKRFWNRVYMLLAAVERELSRHCLLELGLDAASLGVLFPFRSPREHAELLEAPDMDDAPHRARHASIWGQWAGREEEFYRACAGIVTPMRWRDVEAACGAEVRVHAALVRQMHAGLVAPTIPGRLRVGSFQLLGMSGDRVRVQTYSFLDPLDLPRKLFDVLHCFDGSPTREAIARASAEAGEAVPEAAVQKLADYAVLVSAGDSPDETRVDPGLVPGGTNPEG